MGVCHGRRAFSSAELLVISGWTINPKIRALLTDFVTAVEIAHRILEGNSSTRAVNVSKGIELLLTVGGSQFTIVSEPERIRHMGRFWLVCMSAALTGTLLLGELITAEQHKAPSAQAKEAADEQDWMQQCKARGSAWSDSQCALWVSRKEFIHKASCPDHDASVACASFQELVKADDPDLMLDLARQDHVYACFRPLQDVFLEIYFSDPNHGVWQNDARAPNAAVLPGWAEVRYYKNGIASSATSLHSSGKWSYLLTAKGENLATLRVPDGDAVFDGDNIRITGSRFDVSQSYRNDSGLDIHHTLTLQLSTGRFSEEYTVQPSGDSVDNFAGRCFVLPTATQ